MSSAKSQVAIATQGISNLTSASASVSSSSTGTVTGPSTNQSQKDYCNSEDSLSRQNTFGNRRGNPKGKHLTRSHAMREATSPPRTPTPRADNAHVSPNGHSSSYQQQQHHHHQQQHQYHSQQQQQQQQPQMHTPIDGNESYNNNNNNNSHNNNNNSNNNKLHAQTNNTRGTSPIGETPAVIITSQQQQQNMPLSNEAEFPKLSPPKSTKNGSANAAGSSSSNGNGTGTAQRSTTANNHNNNNIISDSNNSKTEQSNNIASSRKSATDFKYVNNGTVADNQRHQMGKQSLNIGNSSLSQAVDNANNGRSQMLASPSTSSAAAAATTTAATMSGVTNAGTYNSGMNYTAASSSSDEQQQQQQQHQQNPYEKEDRNSRQDSQNSSSNAMLEDDGHLYQQQSHHQQQQQHFYDRDRERGGGGNKKHRANSSSKGSKPRLKNMGSSGSVEGNGSPSLSNNTSGFISRVFNNSENSGDQYTDNGGTDLLTFFRETLNNKNLKDRNLLLKIEKDLIELIQDKSRTDLRFPSASSYNRMLIHRTAAYFGMEHNVDADTQQCVIVAVTKNTRIPDIRFKALMRDYRDDSRKSILKRDTHSFDEARQSSYLCPDRGGMLDRKAKSFEEREEDYERARSRIFNRSQHDSHLGSGNDGLDENYMSWSNSVDQHHAQQSTNRGRSGGGKMLKMQGSSESRDRGSFGAVPKAHSYSNYGNGPPQSSGSGHSNSNNNTSGTLSRGDSANSNKNSGAGSSRSFSKQDSTGNTNAPWRLSPSNNGCKTCTNSELGLSDSVTTSLPADDRCNEQAPLSLSLPPSTYMGCFHTTGFVAVPYSTVSSTEDTTGRITECIIDSGSGSSTQLPTLGLVWAVTDISNVPKGSVLINPQTLRPIINQDGSIYHFDPSNLPPSQTVPSNSSSSNNNSNSNTSAVLNPVENQNIEIDSDDAAVPSYSNQTPQQTLQSQPILQTHQPFETIIMQPDSEHELDSPQQQHQLEHNADIADMEATEHILIETPDTASAVVDTFAQTISSNIEDVDESQESSSFRVNETIIGNQEEENSAQVAVAADESESVANGSLSVMTTTSTKNYDRIEAQKLKNQSNSSSIPNEKAEPSPSSREKSVSSEASAQTDRTSSRNQPPVSQASTPIVQAAPPAQQQAQAQQSQQQHHQHPPRQHHTQSSEAPHSSRSTPFSSSDSYAKRAYEEPKPQQAWTYTQSYQAPDGSTVFHTTTTPNSSPYCATTYQQGPDGSVYAIPQGMVYAYPPPVDGEVQGYFMPVYDPTQPRTDPASLMSAGAQAVYPSAPPSATTMVPMAAAYPATQFATTNGTPIFPGQVIYSSDQQQIPMTTYHPTIGYSYPYNGYWGQTMTYYVPTQQAALTNAVTGAPLLPAPPQAAPPPGPSAATLTAAPHITGGMKLGNGLIATPTAGPSTSSVAAAAAAAVAAMGNSPNTGAGSISALPINASTSNGSSFHVHSGTTYYGTGRIKRPTPPHYSVQQTAAPQIMAAMPAGANAGTTYHQIGHAALPTLTLAAAPGSAAAATANDLNNAGATQGATMYALPQHATVFSTNMFPYAATAAPAGAAPSSASNMTANPMLTTAGTAAAPGIPAQPTNAVLTPFYAHRPQLHTHVAPTTHTTHTSSAIHAPGPAAIPIVDPATLTASGVSNTQNMGVGGVSNNSNVASHSAPSTPHSQSIQLTQRNPPLFSTPPIMSSTNGNNGSYSTSSTPQYYSSGVGIDHQTGGASANSPQSVYVPTSSYEKRSSKKPISYNTGSSSNRQGANSVSYNSGNPNKTPMYSSSNDNRGSPNNTNPNSSGNARGHNKGKGSNNNNGGAGADKSQTSISGYVASSGSNVAASSSYSLQYTSSTGGVESGTGNSRPVVRLNAAAASFRHKPSGVEFRRSLSQRNSPGTTNSSSNDNSTNNSPNSISNSAPIYTTTSVAASTSSYGISNTGALINTSNMDHQQHSQHQQQQQMHQHIHQATAPPLYITATAQRTSNIPGLQPSQAQIHHGGSALAATLGGGANATVVAGSQASAVTVLGAEVAAAAAATAHHHQPLLGSYNPGAAATATGVYFKYGQTYLAHPSVSLPNSRRSPSTDLRPPMAQMTGMYPTVNMMIPAPPRHSQGRHPNPNYKGTRPR